MAPTYFHTPKNGSRSGKDRKRRLLVGGKLYYTQDGLGSVRTISDTSGTLKNKYDFEAFGSPYSAGTSETVDNRYTYTGREAGEVAGAPMYYRYRSYFDETGRFGQRDPIGYKDGANLYQYASNRSVDRVDTHGLITEKDVRKAIKRAKQEGIRFAAFMLENWLDGKGDVLDVANSKFKKHPPVVDRMAKYEREEEYWSHPKWEDVEEKANEIGSGMKCNETRTGQRTKTHDLPIGPYEPENKKYHNFNYGLGQYDLATRDYFTICKVCDKNGKVLGYKVTMEKIMYRIEDRYNWDRGKYTWLPGYGLIHDSEMKALEKTTKAAPFDFRTKWWTHRKGIEGKVKTILLKQEAETKDDNQDAEVESEG